MGFERVGDGSGASIAADLGPSSLLLGGGEASENPFTRMLPHTSYVHKGKTSGRFCVWQDNTVN